MRYVALAAGYDGTLARDGRCTEQCVEALRALSATGRKLILVTGRELRDLLEVFPDARVFDYLVAENGAVMHRPATRQSAILAQAPSEILVQELRRRHVTPLSVGSAIVTTASANEAEVTEAIRKLHLDAQLVANDGTILILPAGVNKASGVKAVLKELGLSAHNLMAIGDAENDVALLSLAEFGVAVQNAHPSLKRCADLTTLGSYCDGVIELARSLMSSDLAHLPGKRKLVLGAGEDASEVSIEPCREAILVCGPADSGKSSVCTNLLQQLLREKYQCCVIGTDVNGCYALLPGIVIFGDLHEIPRLTDILDALEQPTVSVAINLAALPMETRPVFVDALLLQLQALHDRVGRPHSILIDQAHCFFAGSNAPHPAPRLTDVTMIYSSSEPAQIPRQVLDGVEVVIALETSSTEIEELCRGAGSAAPAISRLSLPRGQALLWMRQRSTHSPADHPSDDTGSGDQPATTDPSRQSRTELSV